MGKALKPDSGFSIDRQPDVLLLRYKNDFEVTLSPIGAALRRLRVRAGGELRDVTLFFQNPDLYRCNPLYAGATLAPTAGRIGGAVLPIGEKRYPLTANENGRTNLHGGAQNASFAGWEEEEAATFFDEASGLSGARVRLRLTLPDGLDGFPGNRTFTTTYSALADQTLRIDYEAVSDKETYVNVSHHSYFNLMHKEEYEGFPFAMEHCLMIDAEEVILTDDDFLPASSVLVSGTPFDFRKGQSPAALLREFPCDQQIAAARGYNHAYILNTKKDRTKSPVLTFTSPARAEAAMQDLSMQLFTDAPCLTFYSGGFMAAPYAAPGAAFAFEPQDYPDAPGGHGFPYVTLAPGETWTRFITYRFTRPLPE